MLEKIVYVDDEADMRQIAQVSLQALGGFKVTVFESGADALAQITSDVPDLVLLDVMMPDMDGPATLLAIRALDSMKDVPIAFLTAKTNPDEIQELKNLGAIGVIAKPFDPMKLAQQVKDLWAEK